MRYWQISTRRFSKAAHSLTMDEVWHPFESAELSWYRVWKKKTIQRATFASTDEAELFLPLLEHLLPLKELERTGGFREELNITYADEQLVIQFLLGYPFKNQGDQRQFDASLKKLHLSAEVKEGLLYLRIDLDVLTDTAIAKAQEGMALVKQFFQSVQSSSQPLSEGTWKFAVEAFQKNWSNLNDTLEYGAE